MKKSRYDAARLSLISYLERRNYPDTELISANLSQTAEEMAVSSLVECETARSNSILYSCINNDPTLCESQYTKLANFIKDLKKENVKKELLNILCPMLCHMYLEMLRGGNGSAAQMFLSRHSSTLPQRELSYLRPVDGNLPSALYRPNSLEQLFNSLQNGTIDNETPEKDLMNQILDDLGSIYALQEIDSRPLLATFRSCKYELSLSQESLNVLRKYLAKNGHVILLQILQTWFHIDVNNSDSASMNGDDKEISSDQENDPELSNQNDSDSFNECNGHAESDLELRELREAMREVAETKQPLKLYNINTQDTHLIAADIDTLSELLFAGFENSEIRIWNTGRRCSRQPIKGNISRVKLACNVGETSDYTLESEDSTSSQAFAILRGHSGAIQGLSLLRTEGVLMSVSRDSTMRAWNLVDCSCAAIYKGHNYPIWSVDIAKHDLYIATGSHDYTAKLWSLDRTFPLGVFSGHTLDVNCVKFHPNGTYLCTGGADKTVRLWCCDSGKAVRLFAGHRGSVKAIAFSPDGKYVATGGSEKRVRIWDLAAGNCIDEHRVSSSITALSWSENSLAAACFDGSLRVWRNNTEHDVYNTKCTFLVNAKHKKDWLIAIGTTR